MQSGSRKRPMKNGNEGDMDRQEITNAGIRTAHVVMDAGAIAKAKSAFRLGLPTTSKNPAIEGSAIDAYQGIASELGWTSTLNKKLYQEFKVGCVVNGQDTVPTQVYAGDAAMIQYATEMRMKPAGIFKANSESGVTDPTAALIISGLQTVPADGAIPGVSARAYLPALGSGATNGDGTSCATVMLRTRPVNAQLTGVHFRHVIGTIINDPDMWMRAMDGYYVHTHVWINAATSLLDSFLFAGLLFAQMLHKEGKISVPAVDAKGQANSELLATGGGQLNSLEFMSRLAQFTGLIDSGNAAAFFANPSAGSAFYSLLKYNFSRKVTYVPHPKTGELNLIDELGAEYSPEAQTVITPARVPQTRQLKQNSLGQLVGVQHQHLALSASAFHMATLRESEMKVGVYTSSSSDTGTGHAHCSVNVGS